MGASLRELSDSPHGDELGVAKRGKHGWKAKDVGSSGVGCGIVPKKVFKDLELGTCPG